MPSSAFTRRVFCSFLIAAATLLIASAPARGQAAPSLIPYTVSIFAGGGPTATYAKGNLCPVSGNVELDSYGDGCLATELVLKNPRYTTQDAYGNYFFSDGGSYLIRRIDGATGVVTLVAGGGSKPTIGTACPSGQIPTTAEGDGCLGTEGYLGKPAGLAFSPLTGGSTSGTTTTYALGGNLYFADDYNYSVHEIVATGTCSITNPVTNVTTTGACIAPSSTTGGNSTGTMLLTAGTPTGYGYYAGDPTTSTNQVAETGTTSNSSYLDEPIGVTFDAQGDLYITEEYKEAVLVLNTNTTGSTTVGGISIPAGDITKLVGAYSTTVPTCKNATGSSAGCTYPNPAPAYSGTSYAEEIDGPIDVAVDSSGNFYFDEYYDYSVAKVSATTPPVVSAYAGERASAGTSVMARGTATSTTMGVPMGLSLDANTNMYITDASNGFLWRVDSATGVMYAIGGGATTAYTAGVTPCAITTTGATASDAYGDGCPALAAEFSNYGEARPTSTEVYTPTGLQGGYLDSYGNLMVQDAGNALIRKIASGTQFGRVVGTPTQYLDIHFGAGDTPLTSQSLAYVATTTTPPGSPAVPPVFQTETATCGSPNTDGTEDCILPLKIIGTTTGTYTGTLTVTSTANKTATFPLSVTIVVPVASSTATSIVGSCPPGGSSTVNVTVSNTVSQPGGGTVTIYVNGTSVKTATLPSSGTYSTTYTFPVGSTYTIYATYSGDPDDLASTSTTQTSTSFTSGTLIVTPGPNSEASVAAGGTALYTVLVSDYSVLTASVPLASVTCSGLPFGAACVAYPQVPLPSLLPPTGSGCAYGATIALSVTTTQPNPVIYGFGASSKNKWMLLATLPALLLALLVMFRRRKSPLRYSGLLLALIFLLTMAGTLGCGNDFGSPSPGTPTGTYPFSVTVVDSSGDVQTLSGFTLTVH